MQFSGGTKLFSQDDNSFIAVPLTLIHRPLHNTQSASVKRDANAELIFG
jgi:hypothetical protein